MVGPKCEVCNITLFENDMSSHVYGKRHKKKVEQFQRLGAPIPGPKSKNGQPSSVPGSPTAKKSSPQTQTPPPPSKTPPLPPNSPAAKNAQSLKKKPKERGKRKLVKDEGDAKCLVPPAVVDSSKPFEEQVNDFISQVQQTEKDREKINKVVFDVALTFSKVMPGLIPVLYGSQATGLAYKTSDIDVYLCNPHGEENRDFVKLHGRAIHRARLFANIVLVCNARVPVIKARHIETGIELDISATSGQAVANSCLLRFLMCYDNRVRKLMMLIGYWAKKCNMININKFSRYSINLLVIFYLQSLKFRILPPLCELVYGFHWKPWPCYVTENVSLLQNRNYYSFDKLFIGFFEYYSKFPFSVHIISTFLGRKILFSDLEKPHIISSMPYYQRHLASGGEKLLQRIVCIQDPLELSHNTSKQVTEKTLSQFGLLCTRMVELQQKFKVEDWMNEILHGEVAKPILEPRKSQEFAFTFDYETTPNEWCQTFKIDLTKTLALFGISTGNNIPNTTDLKKTKFNSDCLRFYVEATYFPFTKERKRLMQLLKNKTIDFHYFSNNLEKPSNSSASDSKFHFSAQCFLNSPEKDKVKLLFTNEGDHISFYKMVFNFKLLECVLHCIRRAPSAPSKESENTSSKDDSPSIDNK